jgi:hypothetical protein
MKRGIHEECTFLIDSTAEVCNAVHADYFAQAYGAPELDGLTAVIERA